MLHYTTRPLSDRTWLRRSRTSHQFSAGWTDTLELLAREIAYLRGRDVVIECDVREQDLKLDGTFRANARPAGPAVVVAFESKHGPLLYRSDRYDGWSNRPGWQANVRAVALTLQALRAVDRYGATETGQQYAGFKALPAGRAMPASHMTRDDALAEIASYDPGAWTDDDRTRWRRARAAAHPDRTGGDRAAWDRLEEAGRVLGLTS